MKILVTGCNGQVGSELELLAESHDAEFIFTDSSKLNITQQPSVNSFFEEHKFDYCINCAAYTAVDKAEEEENDARYVNINGVRHLAEACNANDATLLHISSDYVYHNNINRPLKETDPTTPQGVYATTKLQGDFAAMSYNPKTIILRTSWIYSSFGRNFIKTMTRLGKQKEQLNVVYDQVGTPTYARDIAQTLLAIISQCEKGEAHYGVFNYSNEGVTSWYDMAKEIFRYKKLDCRLNAILTKDYPTPAVRPHYSVLDKSKIKQNYKLDIPHWRDSLHDCLNLLI